MPAPPKLENAHNPLRVLRGLLSPKGKEDSITQAELSELIDVPGPTIKAIEAGQRGLTLSLLRRVLYGTGAQWDGKRWVCAFEWKDETTEWIWSEKSRPFSYAVFARFYPSREIRPANEIKQVTDISLKLSQLFMLIPDSKWWALALRYYDFVDECWKDYNADELKAVYDSIEREARSVDEYLPLYKQRLSKLMKLRKPGR